MSLGGNIEYRRIRANMTQDELANKVGVTKASISLFENGLKTPSIATLKQLARALETTMDALADNEGNIIQTNP